MGLFGEIEPIPYRLLDELEAQMEANRERLGQQQDLKGMTRPRPQRSIFNATMSSYRRPEPAAHPTGRRSIAALALEITGSGWTAELADGSTVEIQGNWPVAPEGLYLASESVKETIVYHLGDGLVCRTTNPTIKDEITTDTLGTLSTPSQQSRLVLPLGGDAGILLLKWWALYHYQHTVVQRTIADRAFLGLPPTYGPGQHEVTQQQTMTGEILEETPMTTHEGLKAFYFNRSTMREVAVPQRVEELFNVWHPHPEPQEIASPVELVSWYANGCHPFGSTQDTTSVAGVVERRRYVAASTAPPDTLTPVTQARLMQGYGIMPQPMQAMNRVTPAIYSLIDKYEGQRIPIGQFDSAERDQYAAARASLQSQGAAPPFKFIELGFPRLDESSGLYVHDQNAFSTVSPVLYNEVSPAETKSPYIVPNPSTTSMLSPTFRLWDWEQPAYCRRKALQLGFAPEDLRP